MIGKALGAGATAVIALSSCGSSAFAQISTPCDANFPSAVTFAGLPSGLPPYRDEAFGFEDNFDSQSDVPGPITVAMVDRHGESFFNGATEPGERGGLILFVSLDPGNLWVTITATFTEVRPDGSECSRTLSRKVVEKRWRPVVRATPSGVKALGPFRTAWRPRLGGAIRAFGEPLSARRRWGGNGCRVKWRNDLTIEFANFGGQDACDVQGGRAQSAVISGERAHYWRTWRGLRIGQSAREIRRRHRSARKHGRRTWWIVTGRTYVGESCSGGPCPYPIFSVWTKRGRISSFRLWIGAAGE